MIFLTCSKHLSGRTHDFLLQKPRVPIISHHPIFRYIFCLHTAIPGIISSLLNHLFLLKSNTLADLPASLSGVTPPNTEQGGAGMRETTTQPTPAIL